MMNNNLVNYSSSYMVSELTILERKQSILDSELKEKQKAYKDFNDFYIHTPKKGTYYEYLKDIVESLENQMKNIKKEMNKNKERLNEIRNAK